jgi:endonuclease YncB( thermonuclease family)
MSRILVSIVVILIAILPEPVHGDALGRASVIDGDTIEIQGQRIRLHGIDAPESAQLCRKPNGANWRCGQQSALALADHIGALPISCRRTDTDRYGRMIAICFEGATELNAWMVAEGWAVAYRRYSNDYVMQEQQAEEAGKNIWSSRFVMPWDWRRGQRLDELTTDDLSDGCTISRSVILA